MQRVLQNKTFLKLWIGNLASGFGDVLYDVAVVWYITEKTGSATKAGGVALAVMLGKILGGLSVSFSINRIPSKYIMVGSDLIRVLALGYLWYAFHHNPSLDLMYFYIIGFFIAFFTAWFSPVRNKIIPVIIKDPELLVKANTFDGSSGAIIMISSWFLGGIIVALFGIYDTIIVDLFTFVISTLMVLWAKWEDDIKDIADTSFRKTINSYKELKKNKLLTKIVSVETLYLILCGFFWAAIPIKIKELGGGATLFGLQGSFFGLGFLLSSIYFGYKKNINIGKTYKNGISIHWLGNFLASISWLPIGWIVGVFIAGLGNTPYAVSRQTIYQTQTNTENRGNFYAIIEMLSNAVLFPAWLLGSILTDQWSATQVMSITIGLQFIILLYIYSIKELKNINSEK